MKKSKIVEMFNVLSTIKAEQKESSIKFKYAVGKNMAILAPEIKLLQEIEKANAEVIKSFNEERDLFIKEKGEKDDKGNIFISASNKDIIDEFQLKLDELSKKYEEEIKEYEKLMTEYQTLLSEEESTITEFYKFSIDICPDWLSTAQVEFFIKEGILE